MKTDQKSGLMICNVCGHAWSDHGLGGNCLHPILTDEEREAQNV